MSRPGDAHLRGTATIACPGCGAHGAKVFFELAGVPANSCIVLAERAEALRYARGRIELAHCRDCGLIFNRAFEPALTEYSPRYEETQACSYTFRAFHEDLARRLIERYALHGRSVVEIGCGKGEFLQLLGRLGEVRGIGFDPGYQPGRLVGAGAQHVEVIGDFFPSGELPEDIALLCCKMTLEHVARPRELLLAVHRQLQRSPRAAVFFMVPDAHRILAQGAFEDIYYEHCNYFNAASLTALFESCGFDVVDTGTTYAHQYLCIHALTRAGPEVGEPPRAAPGLARSNGTPREFMVRMEALRGHWRHRFQQWQDCGKRVVIWGSGSKSLAFVTLLGIAEQVHALVDINPLRQGSWQPGTGLPIVAPVRLDVLRPDVVIAMNPVYRDEIAAMLGQLAPRAELLAVQADRTGR